MNSENITRPPMQQTTGKKEWYDRKIITICCLFYGTNVEMQIAVVLLVTERFAREMWIGLLTILLCATAHRFMRYLCFTLFLLFRPFCYPVLDGWFFYILSTSFLHIFRAVFFHPGLHLFLLTLSVSMDVKRVCTEFHGYIYTKIMMYNQNKYTRTSLNIS